MTTAAAEPDASETSGEISPELARFPIGPLDAVIRELRASDGLSLEWQGGVDLRSFYDEQWQRHHSGECTVLVVEWNGYPVAQAAIFWRGKPTHPGIPDIQSLRVFPAFRGMGIGTRLLRAGEDVVAGRGHAEISLSVGLENPRAQALYERHGYRIAGEPYFDEWTYTDSRGQQVRVGETIQDLVKRLRPQGGGGTPRTLLIPR